MSTYEEALQDATRQREQQLCGVKEHEQAVRERDELRAVLGDALSEQGLAQPLADARACVEEALRLLNTDENTPASWARAAQGIELLRAALRTLPPATVPGKLPVVSPPAPLIDADYGALEARLLGRLVGGVEARLQNLVGRELTLAVEDGKVTNIPSLRSLVQEIALPKAKLPTGRWASTELPMHRVPRHRSKGRK